MTSVWPGAVAGGLSAGTVLAALAARDAWRAAPSWARALALGRAPSPARPGRAQVRLASRLADAAVPGAAMGWVAAVAGLALAATVLALLAGGPFLAGLALVVSVGGPELVLRARRGRSALAVEAGLPPVLEGTARGLRAGTSLPMALAAAGAAASPALAGDLAAVAATATTAGLVPALDRWAADRPLAGVRLAAAALALATEVGGAGARSLDGVALTLRQRQAAAGEVRALATQARLSAVVLTVAPIAFAGLAAAGDPRTATVLLRSPLGQSCLAAGLALDALGAAWMARITRAGAR